MEWITILIEESKRRNFYIYSQWILAQTALVSTASFVASLVHFPTLLHQKTWLVAGYVVAVQLVTSILTILFVAPFLNIDGERLLQYEYRMLFWLGLLVPNFACVTMGWWPSVAMGLLLLAVLVTHFIAFAKCQPVIISSLVGGDGQERMMLYVSERGRWIEYWNLVFRRSEGMIQLRG